MKKFMILLGSLFFVVSLSEAATSNFIPSNTSDGTSVRDSRVPKKSLFGFGESEFWKKEMKRSGLAEFGSNTKSGIKNLWIPNTKNFFAKQKDAYIERNK